MTRTRRPLALFLLLTGVACVAVLPAGGPSGGLVLADRAGRHLLPLGCLALAALTGAVLLGLRPGDLRKGLVIVLGLVAALFLCGSPLLLMAGGAPDAMPPLPAPGRSDRVLVVEKSTAGFDPLWSVYVHQGVRPLERRWLVGSFGGDAPDKWLGEAVWSGPDRVRMTTSDGASTEVTIAGDGSPDRKVRRA
ncbi:hypothetical protein ACWGHM_28605 [Streptomyces sp. NPDC054904]|uniref:hypothetical protein n=1 Tax=unclassified Streptomyces TaxID=2593676 RepID=UPI0029AB1768|nr:hypothetical protein [Streptomyces sp. DK15]MDX2390791.1 hypothetical protein [Streptomyces sp. DK15]